MTKQTENLIIEILKKMQNEQNNSQNTLTSLVNRVGNVEGELANIHSILAEHSIRMGHFSNRFERIERRLDIVE